MDEYSIREAGAYALPQLHLLSGGGGTVKTACLKALDG
jgi:hypothetical protein